MFVPSSIGLRHHLYGPDVTSLLVGVMGAGVPFPFVHSSNSAQFMSATAMTNDIAMMTYSTGRGQVKGII